MRKKDFFGSDAPFFVGANYWASNAGTFMWRNWDEAAVEKDFKNLSKNGLQVLRVFPLWSDFQKLTDHLRSAGKHCEYRYGEDPLPDTPEGRAAMDVEMLRRFHVFCRLAERYELKLIVGILTGWMSGRLYAPPGLEHRNLLTDAEALRWEVRFVRCFVREMKEEPAIIAWDWGNECNCMGSATPSQMWVWGQLMTSAIKMEDPSRPVASGVHGAESPEVKDMGEVADILTTHPYPLFTPHCNVDYIDSFRGVFHATAQTCWYQGIGKKTAFVEEIGSFGPTITSDAVSAAYLRNVLWNAFAHNCGGLLWWCANDQTELEQTPYDWNSMERELGLLRSDGSPKDTLLEMKNFVRRTGSRTLPPRRIDAVALQCPHTDHWGIAYMTFMLAKKAGFDIAFSDGIGTIPESSCYLLPSIAETAILPRHQYLELLRRVREEGATLYVSSGYSGIQPFHPFGVTIESVAHAASPGRIISAERNIDLTVPRDYSIRTSVAEAEVLATDEEGRPVFTSMRYGKGRLLFLALPLENSLTELPRAFDAASPDYAAIYRIVMEEAGICRGVQVNDPMVTLTEHMESDGTLTVVAVNNSDENRQVVLTVAADWQPVSGHENSVSLAPRSGEILSFRRS